MSEELQTQAPVENTEQAPQLNAQTLSPAQPTEVPHVESAESVNQNILISNLSEDLRNDPSLKDFKDINGLAKSFVEQKRMLGNSIRIPSEDAGEEALNQFYDKLTNVKGVMRSPDTPEGRDALLTYLGRPENPDGYEFQVRDSVPVDPQGLNEFKNLAHQLGLTKEQAQKSMEYYHNIRMGEIDNFNQVSSHNEASLKEMWGNEFQNNVQAANALAQTYKDSYPEAYMDLQKIQNNPIVLDIMANHARVLHEQGNPNIVSQVQKFGMSSAEAIERIRDIQTNPAYINGLDGDPQRELLQQKLNELYPIAYPEDD
jgi:hypothetical protein